MRTKFRYWSEQTCTHGRTSTRTAGQAIAIQTLHGQEVRPTINQPKQEDKSCCVKPAALPRPSLPCNHAARYDSDQSSSKASTCCKNQLQNKNRGHLKPRRVQYLELEVGGSRLSHYCLGQGPLHVLRAVSKGHKVLGFQSSEARDCRRFNLCLRHCHHFCLHPTVVDSHQCSSRCLNHCAPESCMRMDNARVKHISCQHVRGGPRPGHEVEWLNAAEGCLTSWEAPGQRLDGTPG
jgi:hypothetical protein